MTTVLYGAAPILNIAIVGGGIAGLTSAIALLKLPNVRVQIYDGAKEFREIGASIALGPNGLRTLEALGVENALTEDVCTRQTSGWPMIYRHWKTGEVLSYDEYHTFTAARHTTARYHRAHLHEALLQNVPRELVHLNKRLRNVRADQASGVKLFFEDGSATEADICLGADGIHSMVRKAFVPEHTLHWTGLVSLRSAFDSSLLTDFDVPPDAAHWIGPDRTFFHSHLGKGLFTIVGGYNADPTDPDAPYHDAKWEGVGDLNTLRAYYKDWHPTVRAMVEATPCTRLYPNMAGAALEAWTFENRVALIGDAAHTHGGAFASGGSLAIDDAYCFSLALRHIFPPAATEKPSPKRLAQAFKLYQDTRLPHANRILQKVHEARAAQKASVARGKTETDGQLRARVSSRFDPSWIGEHRVEAVFWQTVAKTQGDGSSKVVVESVL